MRPTQDRDLPGRHGAIDLDTLRSGSWTGSARRKVPIEEATIDRSGSTRAIAIVLSAVLLVSGYARPATAQAAGCATNGSSFAAQSVGVDSTAIRFGCARDAGSLRALAAHDDDFVTVVDFNPSDQVRHQATLQQLVDETRADLNAGNSLSEAFEIRAQRYRIGYYQGPPDATGFDGQIHRAGNSLVFVVPQAEVRANIPVFWQKFFANIIAFAVGAIIAGVCLAFVGTTAPYAAPLCGAISGFFGGGVGEILSVVFAGDPVDGDVIAGALGTAIATGISGAFLGASANVIHGATDSILVSMRNALANLRRNIWEPIRHPIETIENLVGGNFGQVLRRAYDAAYRNRVGGTATGVCRESNVVTDQGWDGIDALQDGLRELLDRLQAQVSNGQNPTTNPVRTPAPANFVPGMALRYADLDGDGDVDRVVMRPDGQAEVAQNGGCDGTGARVWLPWSGAGPTSETVRQARAEQIYFGDLDGDDRDDLIAVLDSAQSDTGSPSIQAWQNQSSVQNIAWGQGSRVADNLSYAAADSRTFADIDGDGDDDYLVIGATGAVTAWENTARGFPGPQDWRRIDGFGYPGVGGAGRMVHVTDVTGDGRADALLADYTTGAIQTWENTGNPWTAASGWRSLGTIRTGNPLSGRDGAIFGDLDGDRVADLLLFDEASRSVLAWLLPRYGHALEGPGQPGQPGYPLQLPPGTLPAYGGGDPQPQVTGRLLQNSNFTGGFKPWWVNAGMTPRVDGGVFCVTAPPSTNPWDVLVGHNSIYLPRGSSYTLRFRVRTSVNANLVVQVAPFYNPTNTLYLAKYPTVTGGGWRQYEYTFNTTFSNDYVLSQLQFRLGGAQQSYEFCMDDVTLNGNSYVYRADRGPAVKVNQLGYLPTGPKRATVVTTASGPQPWTLRRVGGATVATGQSSPAGFDGSAGAAVHLIDFGQVSATGRFELVVGGQASHPFEIRQDLYASLRVDAMRFFYPNRSGIAIDGGIAGAAYARPAGHVAAAPNGGDTRVPCQTPKSFMNNWTCDYTLDVTGGWYDAGDHGKYVVNGGIATYQLLSAWERALAVGRSGPLGDSTLAVPERGNGVPDILDEARWNLEFLLKMQVPAGRPLAGMAHHKVHDESWTGPPMLPHQDRKLRELHRPSTAATLNLAAVAAQGARVYAPYDAAFAARLRTAAERAWSAASANPALYAPQADRSGGGPYADADVTDEFYWAAAQLYLTTGSGTYLNAVRSSRLHAAGVAFDQNGFYWGSVAALAQLDLARYGTGLSEQTQIRTWVRNAADRLISYQRAERFGQTYTPTSGRYDWGSNASMLNNQVVIATAYDLTGNTGYADAVFEGLDYLLGRNALGRSYITGYGSNDAENQHSRWYAKSFDATLPNPPVGSVAGGPNSSLQDPLSAAWLHGCAPQLCYVDNLEAWSVNEITINWNSALAWVSAFTADVAPRR